MTHRELVRTPVGGQCKIWSICDFGVLSMADNDNGYGEVYTRQGYPGYFRGLYWISEISRVIVYEVWRCCMDIVVRLGKDWSPLVVAFCDQYETILIKEDRVGADQQCCTQQQSVLETMFNCVCSSLRTRIYIRQSVQPAPMGVQSSQDPFTDWHLEISEHE